jgi:hypothetical protein
MDVILPTYCAVDHFDDATLSTERLLDDGTYDVPKRAGDLLKSGLCILVRVMLVI